ncbi:hypothetical protein THAOC_17564 [Thalassiosira oceanica]|uniref:Uncharacterized protein n=1 Tax=Thalassiosira oceanica TaxID=159749 RepID=K0SLM4_THAOC|nr:hypothetical protein THAOC_17564 [Thalassiosira oceanica]|eukprot:EJK61866.1 hypothetical protein THAOC_17564 [Thalassiosira oceanica]
MPPSTWPTRTRCNSAQPCAGCSFRSTERTLGGARCTCPSKGNIYCRWLLQFLGECQRVEAVRYHSASPGGGGPAGSFLPCIADGVGVIAAGVQCGLVPAPSPVDAPAPTPIPVVKLLHPGLANKMADDCSRLWHLSDSDLLAYFGVTYPQSEPWQICHLEPESASALLSALSCNRQLLPEMSSTPAPESANMNASTTSVRPSTSAPKTSLPTTTTSLSSPP